MHNSPLPQTLLDTVRRQYDIFMRVQHLRYFGTSTSSPLAGDGRAHGSGPVSPDQQGSTRDVAEEERSVADWSEEYRRCAQTLVDDPAANAVWGLASSIIRIHETGGTASVNASLALIEWYEAFLIDADYVHNKLQELLDVEFQSCTDDDVYVAGAFFLSAIERTFFAGNFNVSARIMDALLCALRSDLEEPIPADVESCLADVRRLLCVSFAGAEEHQSWQMDANDQVFEAKRILGDYVDAAAGCSSASRKIAASICAFSRDALLIMSGDAALIRSRCMESGLSLVEYVAAVCAITDPFANLAELSSIFDSCSKSWAEETHASSSPKWQYIMMGALFRTVCVEDVVEAMGKAGEQAATFAWEPMLEEEEEEGDEAGQQLSESCQRRYLLASMAAHVSDLCVQIRPRSELRSVKALFTRNTLVANYAQLVAHRPWTWRVGMSYCAYSPLMNPVELYSLALDAARWAAKDNSSYASWMACMQQLWDADSLLQTTLHRRLVEMTGDSPTTHKWFRALYHYRQKAYTDAHHFIIATRFNAGDVAYAVWLAVEVHLPQAVEKEIRRVLTSPNALRSNCIYAIGEAVHSSYISLDASPSISLSHSLSLCSAIAAYRRADRSVEVAAASSQSEMADATIRCIDSVRAVLLRAEEWSLSLSHETVLALVERAVDHLRQLREMLIRGATRGGRQSQDDGMRESAGLVVGYSLPALSKCLETSTIQQRRVISVSSTLARRTALLRERLAMLVDCHV